MCATALVLSANAQQQLKQAKGSPQLLRTKTVQQDALAKTSAMVGDTVGWQNYTDFLPQFSPSGQLSVYGYTGGGYVYGKNKDSLNVCAAGFINASNATISTNKVIIWVAAKSQSVAATSNISVRLWDMAANKAYSYNGTSFVQDKEGPNTVKAAALVPYSSIDTSFSLPTSPWTIVNFTNTAVFSGDFAVEVNTVPLAPGDTIGLVSDKKNDAAGVQMTFHRAWYGATSYSPWVITDGGFFTAGGLDNNVAIFPILSAITGVKEYVNGVKLSALYPNPTKDVATISYSLEKESNNVSLTVYNVVGTKVYSESFGTQAAGDYKINLDASSYAAGSYFYQLRANGHTITKEFVVTK